MLRARRADSNSAGPNAVPSTANSSLSVGVTEIGAVRRTRDGAGLEIVGFRERRLHGSASLLPVHCPLQCRAIQTPPPGEGKSPAAIQSSADPASPLGFWGTRARLRRSRSSRSRAETRRRITPKARNEASSMPMEELKLLGIVRSAYTNTGAQRKLRAGVARLA